MRIGTWNGRSPEWEEWEEEVEEQDGDETTVRTLKKISPVTIVANSDAQGTSGCRCPQHGLL